VTPSAGALAWTVTVPSGRYSFSVARAEDTRERILFGAEEVVLRDGVAHLTLEAAASEAGISKGGVLYHFPTRAALVAAMVQRLSSSFDADLERAGGSSHHPGAFTRAYVEATFGPPTDATASRERRLGAAVIAGVAADTELLEPLRERFAAWQHALVTDGLPAASASLVRLAADGLWFTELLGLAPLDTKLRSSVRDGLLALVDSSPPPVAPRKSRVGVERHGGRSRREKSGT
jgi:AcrR family transcriptional regulator